MAKPARSLGQRMGLAAVILSVSILFSRLLGFAREVIISSQYGASVETDAYIAAFTLPELMNYFLAGGTLSITFIPLFSSFVTRGDEEGGWRLFSTVASTFGLILVGFVILGEIFAPTLVSLTAPGFDDPQQKALVVSMTRIVLPAQLCFYFGGLIQATLFVKEVFWTAALAPLIYNLGIILGGLILGQWFGIQGFSIGVLIGAVLGPLLLPLWAVRKHARFTFRWSLKDKHVRQFLKLSLPLMLGATLVTVDEFFLRILGSTHERGSITWLNNARKLMMVLFAIIGQAAGQAALPYLSRLFNEGKEEQMGDMLSLSLQRLIFLSLCASAGLMAVASPLVFSVFRHGAFSVHDATQTAWLLVIFSVGLTSWTVQSFAVRGFYARQDTLTPMIFGTIILMVMVPIYWALNAGLGVSGLAMATSVGISINAFVTLIVYAKRYGHLDFAMMGKGAQRGIGFALVCGGTTAAVGWYGQRWLPLTSTWTSIGLLCACAVVYLGCFGAMVWLFHPPELDVVMDRVKRKLKRN